MPASQPLRIAIVSIISTLVVLAATALASAYAGVWRIETAGGPSTLETRLARIALDASVARRAPRIANPIGASDSALLRGLKIYRDNCAGCHGGVDGKPAAFGLGFYPPAPPLIREPTRRPESELFYLVRNGIRRTGMTAWSSIMPDDDIWRVVGFLHRIDSLPRSVDSVWHTPPSAFPGR